MTTTAPPPSTERVEPKPRRGVGDRVFQGLSTGAGIAIMVALAGVFVFLLIRGLPALSVDPSTFQGSGATTFLGYVWPLVYGTAFAAVLALIISVPFAIGIALFISHYAPRRLATPVAYVMDLLAAVPSVVYGLWGGGVLNTYMQPIIRFLADHLGFLPFFSDENVSITGRTMLTAGLVLAIMILPITAAIMREVFSRTPRLNEEAALALGATRWEMIRLTVFPYSRSGMISAVMLGLGRALGETMAVAMVLSSSFVITLNLIGSSSPRTIAANVAANYKESGPAIQSVLIATGLVLFAFTFAVNFLARWAAGRGERRMAR